MTGAKPLYRFRDRALAGLMAARGWIPEGRLQRRRRKRQLCIVLTRDGITRPWETCQPLPRSASGKRKVNGESGSVVHVCP